MANNTTTKLLIALVALALVATACSLAGNDDSDSGALDAVGAPAATIAPSSAPEESQAGTDAGEAPAGERAELGDGGIEPTALPASQTNRDIIFTADLTVAVSDVGSAGAQATQAIESLGGFLFGQDTRGEPDPRSVLTFKVAPEVFQEALARLGEIGEVRTQNVTADDVTERVVDLESRITTAEASVERLRGFLENATDIKTITDIESQLKDRETELETLRGQLRTIQGLVNLATIFLTLTEAESRPEVVLSVTGYRDQDSGSSCPGNADISVDEGDPMTLCFEVVNVGDTNLQDFTIKDAVLGIEAIDDLTLVFGDPASVLEPGQSMILAFELSPERALRTQTRLTAVPILEDGTTLSGRTVSQTESNFIDARDPGGLPGFSDGLTAGWALLVNLVSLVILALGAILPFIWLAIPIWLFVRRRRSRASAERDLAAERRASPSTAFATNDDLSSPE
ncbi:MAG: DUF4349 domain-containing protein [Acidimicrobiia bacterium]|nr:DUF4349 domain-containing protein [Acidimicrobiia bacterium]